MKVEVRLNLDDLIKFNENRADRNIANKFLYMAAKVSLVMLPLGIIGKYLLKYNISNNILIVLFLIPFIKFVITPFNVKCFSKRAMRKNVILRSKQIYDFSQDGVSIRVNENDAFLEWDKFPMIIESKEYIELYIANTQAYIIPKRFVEKEEELIKMLKNIKKDKYYNM